jgi:hypothetical protein
MNKKVLISAVVITIILIGVAFYASQKRTEISSEVVTAPIATTTPEVPVTGSSTLEADLNTIDGEGFEADINNINADINGLQ